MLVGGYSTIVAHVDGGSTVHDQAVACGVAASPVFLTGGRSVIKVVEQIQRATK